MALPTAAIIGLPPASPAPRRVDDQPAVVGVRHTFHPYVTGPAAEGIRDVASLEDFAAWLLPGN